VQAETVITSSGKLEFEKGYPSKDTAQWQLRFQLQFPFPR